MKNANNTSESESFADLLAESFAENSRIEGSVVKGKVVSIGHLHTKGFRRCKCGKCIKITPHLPSGSHGIENNEECVSKPG